MHSLSFKIKLQQEKNLNILFYHPFPMSRVKSSTTISRWVSAAQSQTAHSHVFPWGCWSFFPSLIIISALKCSKWLVFTVFLNHSTNKHHLILLDFLSGESLWPFIILVALPPHYIQYQKQIGKLSSSCIQSTRGCDSQAPLPTFSALGGESKVHGWDSSLMHDILTWL